MVFCSDQIIRLPIDSAHHSMSAIALKARAKTIQSLKEKYSPKTNIPSKKEVEDEETPDETSGEPTPEDTDDMVIDEKYIDSLSPIRKRFDNSISFSNQQTISSLTDLSQRHRTDDFCNRLSHG